MTTFAHRLRSARTALGWSQSQLARRAGIPKYKTISEYERGRYQPRQHNRMKLADALGVSADWLLGRDG